MTLQREGVKKVSAFIFLLVFGMETFYPGMSYALTSGPSQPEMQKFTPAGVNDMVDLFTGDFKNNIPLLDVDGYPLNLSYQSGSGVDDEASWVGVGWSLNPGAVNRTMRGLPDDFNGDKIQKHFETKKFVKVGGSVSLKTSVFAWETGSVNGSVNLNIYKDNYWGIGASVGASLSASLGRSSSTGLTAGMGLGLNSDVRDGLSITPNLSIDAENTENRDNISGGGLSGSLTYNTRSGLKNVSLSASYSTKAEKEDEPSSLTTSSVHYFGQSHTPSIQSDNVSSGQTFAFDLGATAGLYLGAGGKGFVYKSEVKDKDVSVDGFGYLNYLNGRSNIDALLDFNREKDGVFITSTPAIPVPVATHDLFMASGQAGSQQFRPHFAGNYVVFDKAHYNKSDDASVGLTVGFGNIFKAGGRVEYTKQSTFARKWIKDDGNKFLIKAEATGKLNPSLDPTAEPFYFKQSGEHTRADQAFFGTIGNETVQNVDLYSINTDNPKYRSAQGVTDAQNVVKTKREIRNYGFSALNAAQASQYGLETTINGTPRVNTTTHLPHHMSEVTVTSNDGKRMVYGIPVYNLKKKEVSFSIDHNAISDLGASRKTGLVAYTQGADGYPKHLFGRDQYLSAETLPAYASSFLITGVLSPDYVDVTHNGITDDDLGTAVKFDYKKLASTFKWRAPFGLNQANFSEGSLSDTKDDKASYVYGEKEIWYLDKVQGKTMIAIFHTSDREDALGVLGETGGANTIVKQKKLDSIRLFSKSDWLANGANAVPVKVVHFEYDYSLYPGVPNNTGNAVMSAGDPSVDLNAAHGKLTLKRVYFTFGKNTRGQSNPYEFFYDLRNVSDLALSNIPVNSNVSDPERNEVYATQQSDGWGTYKPSFYNAMFNGSATPLTNPEFPYTLQSNAAYGMEVKQLVDHFASKWQLNKIITPTGSIINIDYESDDYAYVQDRRAMQMCRISGVVSSPKGFADAAKLIVKLPVAVSDNNALRKKYLEGLTNIFYKVMLDLDNSGHREYVYGYAAINPANCTLDPSDNTNKTALIAINPVEGYNPVAKAAWQKLRVELPQFAYDNYDNSEVSSDFIAAIRSIVSALGNLRELVQPFDSRAVNRGFASQVDYNRSMVRLNNPDGRKLGGGARVAKITISDDWNNMTQTAGTKTASFGQRYDYTIRNNDGTVFSSGVASYEPQIGSEENPFHEPVNFTEKVHWGLDKYHFMEKPFCETYFPAAQVGYSKVTMTPIGDDYAEGVTNPTGYTENEFYTAKEFPVIVENTALQQQHSGSNPILSLFASVTTENLLTSQGFKVEINDMHGKPKSVKTYSKGGDLLASTEYFYSVDSQNDIVKHLNNKVDILETDGSISHNVPVATDIDVVTDVREHHNENIGTSVGAYAGWLQAFILPIIYGAVQVNASVQSDTYKSSSYIKVVHKFGITTKVRTMQNGSTTEAENLLWDGVTGEVLLSRTQNAFNDYIYNFHYPAHMIREYDGMGGAYQNLGAIFNIGFASTTISATGSNALCPGDELINLDLTVPKRGWVINSGTTEMPVLKLVDDKGALITTAGTYQVVRSGRRNLLNAGAGTIVCAKDPRVDNHLVFAVDRKVLNAESIQYNQDWSMPMPNTYSNAATCGPGYQLSADGLTCYRDTVATQTNSGSGGLIACKVPQTGEYSSCGSMIYSSYNTTGTAFTRSIIATNPFWIGKPSDYALYCAYTPAFTRSQQAVNFKSGSAPRSLNSFSNSAGGDTIPASLNDQPAGTNVGKVVGSNSVSKSKSVGTNVSTEPVYYGPLNRCGIWVCPNVTLTPYNKWIGFSRTINVPESKNYYVGLGADNNYRFKVDGVLKVESPYQEGESFKVWHIYPVYLTQGVHTIEMEAQNTGSIATFGAEIYNNTELQLRNATSYNSIDTLFSTRNMVGQSFQTGVYTCPSGYTLNTNTTPYSCRETVPASLAPTCLDPVGRQVNPYVNGIKGNWRPQKNYVYTVAREQKAGSAPQNGGTDIRRSGGYTSFTPFWNFSGNTIVNNLAADVASRWVWSNSSIYFDQQGNEIEKVDALGRYGSALFGYQSTLATAVAGNARHNEVMFDGFEDYGFMLPATQNCPSLKHFDWRISRQGSLYKDDQGNQVDASNAHSGKYSFKLTHATTITKPVGAAEASISPILSTDAAGRYILNSNELAKGYAPVRGKKQLLSMWVYDGNSNSNKVQNLVVKINGSPIDISNTVVPVIEGWKLLEIPFTAGNLLSTNFSLTLEPSGTVNIDDIRILPFDADLKSFVYDEYTLRLMAQLDENNFATFYEYDDEGTLIRVKKETDRGIMTLKETRKAYRKRN